MPNAKELAAIAGQVRNASAAVKPVDADPFANMLNLAVFHLNSAAKLLREVAEAKASREGVEV